MYIKIRLLTGKETVITVSKTDPVASLKKQVQQEFGIAKSKQRLFFQGKQLEDGYTLHDYRINVNDTIQVMEKVELEVKEPENESEKVDGPAEIPCDSEYFRVGDIVDALDVNYGAWFDGIIIDIVKCLPDYEIYYKVQFFTGPVTPTLVLLKNIRPVARRVIPISSLKEGDMVMVNYNSEDPDERGFWYDFKVGGTLSVDGKTIVQGTLYVGVERTPTENIAIIFPDEMMQIEENKLLTERTAEELQRLQERQAIGRKTAPMCKTCKDNPRRKCRECGCDKCGGKEDPEKQLVCDECENAYHIWCLNPPLETLPEVDDWYCDHCRNDESEVVKAGEKLKASKKKTPASTCKRDWGRGMACVGTTKKCTKVPHNHFGPIPGIEVGMSWLYRIQVAEEGVHRPPVAGMHGRPADGAYSIVLSGGYEDDIDNGEEFMYTGAGGRDLSGNKRTAEQSLDQELTRTNKALAINCHCKFDAVNGGDAGADWKKGKPVRVVRNSKLAKHSKYAPKEGNRYDGIYKVVKYFPVKGQSGFIVWRYLLRRDDPTPAPWTKEGKARIAALGLELIYPENWQEIQAKKNKTESDKCTTNTQKTGRKRKTEDNENVPVEDAEAEEDTVSPMKKMKISYNLDPTIENLIKADEANSKMWADLREHIPSGRKAFLDKVEEAFSCVCCMGLVYNPITTPCSHNVCKNCLKRSYDSKITSCPYCRHELGQKFDFDINEHLSKALHHLFPGYTASF